MNYHAYIKSPEWAATRDDALHRAHCYCEFCGWQTPDPHLPPWWKLHVHHLTYRNLGNEQPEDLIVLCSSCHHDVHHYPKRADEVQRFANLRYQPTTIEGR